LGGLNREIYIYDWDSNTIINQYKIPYMNWAGGIAVNYDDNKFHIVTDVDNEEPMLFVHSYNPELIYQNK
jgi:imidazoleglycerol phosphate synthase glutamine amidotransferase subunit HisH